MKSTTGVEVGSEPGVKRGAFFDLEKTMTPDAVEQVTAIAFYRRGELSLMDVLTVAWIYLRYDLGLLSDFEAMKRLGAGVFGGRSAEGDVAAYADYFEDRLKGAIHPEALQLVGELHAASVEIYIVSSTYQFMVDPFARLFGVHDSFGATLEVKDGVCTGALEGEIYHQEAKAAVVRRLAAERGLDLEHSFAFGDSTNDRFMLEAVGRPYTVNPSRGLLKLARANDWPVLKWGGRGRVT